MHITLDLSIDIPRGISMVTVNGLPILFSVDYNQTTTSGGQDLNDKICNQVRSEYAAHVSATPLYLGFQSYEVQRVVGHWCKG